MSSPSSADWERGSWMQTFTGRRFYPLDPSPADIDRLDIAHALSLICRYGGHTRRFYSVAEHCVLMSHAVPTEHALWALLHDATEAYVGDMVRPLKHHLPAYREIEDVVMASVAEHFDLITEWTTITTGRWYGATFLPFNVPVMPTAVKDADNRILLDERAALLTPTDDAWQVDGLEPLGVHVSGWDPLTAEYYYRARLDQLTGSTS